MTTNDPKDAKKRKEEKEQEAKNAKRTAEKEEEKDKEIREAAHDHTVAESMVASDPPSSIPDPRDEDALEEQSHPRVKPEEGKE